MTHVLVVEDDPDVAELLRQSLHERLGLEVRVEANGALVSEAMAADRPDLLILDLSLPGLSGVDVFDVVRGDERWRGVPILFITATPDRVERANASAAPHEVLAKPFDVDELVRRVDALRRVAPEEAA